MYTPRGVYASPKFQKKMKKMSWKIGAALFAISSISGVDRSLSAFTSHSLCPIISVRMPLDSSLCGSLRPAGASRSFQNGCQVERSSNLQMARGGGARGGGARGGAQNRGDFQGGGTSGGRGKGAAKRRTGLDVDAEDWGVKSSSSLDIAAPIVGKKLLNQMLSGKSDPSKHAQAGRGSVGGKMQDFDPKKMERGTVRFLGSFDAAPPAVGLPEVAFVGRSNVGKSSMLNSLTNSKIAVTSKTPGRTQRVNLFAWKESKRAARVIAMVDLPGFGFAQVSRGMKRGISDLLSEYLANRAALKLVVVLIDLRVEPQKTDMDTMELLYSQDIPFIVAGTKADKLSNNEMEASMSKLETALGIPPGQLIAYSSVSGEGRQFLWKQIMLGLFDDDADDDSLGVSDDEIAEGDSEDDDGDAVVAKLI